MRKIKSLMAITVIAVMFSIGSPVNAQTNDNNTTISEQTHEDRDDDDDTNCGWIGLVGLLGLLGLLGLRKKNKEVIVHTTNPTTPNKY